MKFGSPVEYAMYQPNPRSRSLDNQALERSIFSRRFCIHTGRTSSRSLQDVVSAFQSKSKNNWCSRLFPRLGAPKPRKLTANQQQQPQEFLQSTSSACVYWYLTFLESSFLSHLFQRSSFRMYRRRLGASCLGDSMPSPHPNVSVCDKQLPQTNALSP